MSYLRIMSFVLFILCFTAAGNNNDTLLYSLPLSSSGYSGVHLKKTGECLPDPPVDKKDKGAGSASISSLSVGFSGSHIDFVYSAYPSSSFSSAMILSFWNDKTKNVQYAKNEVPDSIMNMLGDTLPSAVSQTASLNHIRTISEIRLNTIKLLPYFGNVPFTFNPYIGIGIFSDFSFGNFSQHAVDSIPAGYPDSVYSGYDTSISRYNVDVGFEIPVGIELFPLKKTNIPVLNSIGFTFTYSFMSGYRVFAYPDTNTKYDAYEKSGNSEHSSIYTTDSSSTGSDTKDNGGKSDFWYGFKKIKTKNEFRFGITVLF